MIARGAMAQIERQRPKIEPALRRLAGVAPRAGLVDRGLLVVELVHRHLIIAVCIKLPAAIHAGLRDLRSRAAAKGSRSNAPAIIVVGSGITGGGGGFAATL